MTADGDDRTVDGADESPGSDDRPDGVPTCPHCDAPLSSRHCKYVCPQHGVVIDCSDPFR